MEEWLPKFSYMPRTQQYGDRARAELERGEYGRAVGTALRASGENMADAVGHFLSFYPKLAASALGGVAEGVMEPAAPAQTAPVRNMPLPTGTFDAPVAPQRFRQPGARAANQPSLMARAPNAPSYSLEDFLKGTANMNTRQLEQLYRVLPAPPKAPSAKERVGNSLYEMAMGDYEQGIAAATTDEERRAVFDRTRQALQGMYGVDPFTAYLMQQGALPEE